MRERVILGILVCLIVPHSLNADNTQIQYEITDLDFGRWEYTYDVFNINLLEEIEEFTIWFDYDLYSDLSIETTTLESSNPPAGNWHEIVWQREEVLRDDGGYDALALDTGIVIGEAIRGFAVSFDWLGVGEPSSQYYEIINPETFVTIADGYTVPEPGTLSLFIIGGLTLLKRKGKHYESES